MVDHDFHKQVVSELQSSEIVNNQPIYATYGSDSKQDSDFQDHDEESIFKVHYDGFQYMTMGLEQLSLFSQSTSSWSSIRYASMQNIATSYMDFSSNDYVLGNYDDNLSLDCEECLVLEQLGDIPLAISNNSLTENSLQEKLY